MDFPSERNNKTRLSWLPSLTAFQQEYSPSAPLIGHSELDWRPVERIHRRVYLLPWGVVEAEEGEGVGQRKSKLPRLHMLSENRLVSELELAVQIQLEPELGPGAETQ